MEWLSADGYWLGRLVFQRTPAVIYLVAFLSAALQFRALIGEHGILPPPELLRRTPWKAAPGLFRLHYSDRFFAAVAWGGCALPVTLIAGLDGHLPLWGGMLLWALPWVLSLSVVQVGQVWYGFGWESLLLETGFLAILLGTGDTAPPVLVLWLLRMESGAGLIKIRGDACWRSPIWISTTRPSRCRGRSAGSSTIRPGRSTGSRWPPTTSPRCWCPFLGKPGDVRRLPRPFAPYHLRLDWMM